MAKQLPSPGLGPDHPLTVHGLVHEAEIYEPLGYKFSTWERDFRTKTSGITTPSGRWVHIGPFVNWLEHGRQEAAPKIDFNQPVFNSDELINFFGYSESQVKKWCQVNRQLCEPIAAGKFIINTAKFVAWIGTSKDGEVKQ